MKTLRIAFALLAGSSALQAQVTRCSNAPGSIFGVVAYQCANCGFKYETGRRPSYSFFAEPVVTQADESGMVKAGDIIEAVNSQPITTQAGAEQFAYPPEGKNMLQVRRGRSGIIWIVNVPTKCAGSGSGAGASGTGGFGAAAGSSGSSGASAGGGSGSGGRQVYSTPMYIIDGVRVDDPTPAGRLRATARGGSGDQVSAQEGVMADSSTGRFGFGVECRPSCSMQRDPDGMRYYKYNGYPVVIAVRAGSAADRAGMRRGDEIIKVNGRSILEDTGTLQRAEQQEQIRLTVRRDGKDVEMLMLVTR